MKSLNWRGGRLLRAVLVITALAGVLAPFAPQYQEAPFGSHVLYVDPVGYLAKRIVRVILIRRVR